MYLSAIDRNEGPLLQTGVSESVISGNVDLVDASSTFDLKLSMYSVISYLRGGSTSRPWWLFFCKKRCIFLEI